MTTGARTGPASFETAGPLPFQPGPAGFVFGRATRSSLERRACESDSTKKPAAERLDATRPDARQPGASIDVSAADRLPGRPVDQLQRAQVDGWRETSSQLEAISELQSLRDVRRNTELRSNVDA